MAEATKTTDVLDNDLVFYDTETTGLDTNFVQILQTGMIATDKNFKVLSSKKLDGRYSPWELPSPGALLTTGFTIEELEARKNSNFDLMQELNAWVGGRKGPLTFIGYNSLGYDEPVLAQNFYQNLLPPNLTTGQGNGRADVIVMVRMTAMYMPKALKLEIKNFNGAPSMTLKNVARQNGVDLSDEEAHDALNDIKATAGVAQVIQKVAPQIWEQSLKMSTVAGVDKFMAENEIFTAADFAYGSDPKASVVTSLAEFGGNVGAAQALFDLRIDPAPFMGMTVDQLKAVFLSKENNPFVTVSKNEQPALMPVDQSAAVLTEKDDIALFEKRAAAVKADQDFLANVAAAAQLAQQEKQAALPAKMPEALIDKTVSPDVQKKLDAFTQEFREAKDWHERAVLTGSFYERFKDELAADPALSRFEKLAARLVFEHAPAELSASRQQAMNRFIANRFLDSDPNAPYMTIARARKELSKIRFIRTKPDNKWADLTEDQLRKLDDYYKKVEDTYAKYLPGYKPANDSKPKTYTPWQKPPSTGNSPKA